jgi:hypothetical protein
MSKVIYTFKTFPHSQILDSYNPFVFKKLKENFIELSKIVSEQKPAVIIGVAMSTNKNSYFESRTLNIFNREKKISKIGIEEYALNYPTNGFEEIIINSSYTDVFCNWTMYKISEYIADTEIKLQFIHINEKHLSILDKYLKTI